MTGKSTEGLGRIAATESWHKIKADGVPSRMHGLILEAIRKHGPMTGTECYRAIERDHGLKLNYNTRTRFGELRDAGLLDEAGLRHCTVTGKRVIVWKRGSGKPQAPVERCESCGQTLPRKVERGDKLGGSKS